MERVRQALGVEPDDTSKDDEIKLMTEREVLTYCLEWEGIIGYTGTILGFIDSIYDTKLR